MWDMADICCIFLPANTEYTFRQLAVPVCRRHGHDDVLPNVPDEVTQELQYTLLREPTGNIVDASSPMGAAQLVNMLSGDAADSFAGHQDLSGLVIVSNYQIKQHAASWPFARFPWHPKCGRFRRLGCSVSRETMLQAAARQQQWQRQQQQHNFSMFSLSGNKTLCQQHQLFQRQRLQLALPAQLVPVGLHAEPDFLADLAAAIISHNEQVLAQQLNITSQQSSQCGVSSNDGGSRNPYMQLQLPPTQSQQRRDSHSSAVTVLPLLLQTVQRVAAALAISSAWRSHRCRLVNRIAELALATRAAKVIQRSWRAFALHHRLRLLSTVAAAWRTVQQYCFSGILCLDVGSNEMITAAAESSRLRPGLLLEHRLRFVIDDAGAVMLVDINSNSDTSAPAAADSNSSNNTIVSTSTRIASSKQCRIGRVGLPTWVIGDGIPVISAAAAAKVLEDQSWFEPFDRTDAAKLLQIGCDVQDVLPPSLTGPGSKCHPTEIAQIITFKSKRQAAQRAALLAALTYDVRSSKACKLLSMHNTPLGAAYKNLTGAGNHIYSRRKSSLAAPQLQHSIPRFMSDSGGSRAFTARSSAGADLAAATTAADAAAKAIKANTEWMPGLLTVLDAAAAAARLGVRAGPDQVAPAASATARPPSTGRGDADRSLLFYTSVLHRLPHLTKLLAAEQAGAGDGRTSQQDIQPKQQQLSIPAKAGSGAQSSGQHLPALSQQAAGNVAGQWVPNTDHLADTTIHQLATRDHAAYLQGIKQEQAAALRFKLTEGASIAAEAAAADLLAKQQLVASVKAGSGPVYRSQDGSPYKYGYSSSQQPDSVNYSMRMTQRPNCLVPGYWPLTTSEASENLQALKHAAQQAAADVAAAVRQEVQEGHAEMLRQQAGAKAAAQHEALQDTQAVQRQLVQEVRQREQAVPQRVDLLKLIRSHSSRQRQQQQVANAFSAQCTMFSKHLKQGELAVVRAAQLTAAKEKTKKLRQLNADAQANKHQQERLKDEMDASKVAQQRAASKQQVTAAHQVQDLEAAARRARVAAQLLLEQQQLQTIGPAGGVWGSANPSEVLKSPLRATVIGDVSTAAGHVSQQDA